MTRRPPLGTLPRCDWCFVSFWMSACCSDFAQEGMSRNSRNWPPSIRVQAPSFFRSELLVDQPVQVCLAGKRCGCSCARLILQITARIRSRPCACSLLAIGRDDDHTSGLFFVHKSAGISPRVLGCMGLGLVPCLANCFASRTSVPKSCASPIDFVSLTTSLLTVTRSRTCASSSEVTSQPSHIWLFFSALHGLEPNSACYQHSPRGQHH